VIEMVIFFNARTSYQLACTKLNMATVL